MMSIALRFKDVDVLAASDTLHVSTCYNLKPGLLLGINTPTEKFWADVMSVKRLPWSDKHDFEVGVTCDRMDALRKAFTYEVVGGHTIVAPVEAGLL